MRIVDKEEAIEWLASGGSRTPKGVLEAAFPRKATISVDKDSGRKVLNAKGFVYQFGKFDEWMLSGLEVSSAASCSFVKSSPHSSVISRTFRP